MLNLETEIQAIPKIQPKYAQNLSKLGIFTIHDLLFHFPFRYDDFSKIYSISEIANGQTVTIQGEITKIKTARTWKKECMLLKPR